MLLGGRNRAAVLLGGRNRAAVLVGGRRCWTHGRCCCCLAGWLDGGWLMVDAGWTLLESGDARCCWLPAVRTVSENGEVSEK